MLSKNASNSISRSDIAAGLTELGLCAGDQVLVHSSLIALGKVDGGPDAVIDALIEAVGPEGLVVVPTFACASPFDRRKSSTPLGAIPETLWKRPEAVRSLHPTHSIAAIGKGAEDLIRDHEKQPTAYAEGTPYYKLARSGGKILLLGVDQDRNTTLHAAEAIAGAPYLTGVEGAYIDDGGREVTIPVAAMAGPHRDFIGLDRLFRERGIMKIGRIGDAVCRLMDAGQMLDIAIEAMRRDPAAVLCDNPACADCVMQRGKIKAARLAKEDFTLAVEFSALANEDLEAVIDTLQGEGISAVEMTPKDHQAHGAALAHAGISVISIRSRADDMIAASLAAGLGVPLVVPVTAPNDFREAMRLVKATTPEVFIMNDGPEAASYEEMYRTAETAPKLAFNPGRFAAAGEHPFLGVFYRGRLRKQMERFYIADETWSAESTLPGQGNGEVKEIISMLRCRGYSGVMTLCPPSEGIAGFRATAAAFWNLLDNM